MRYLSSYQSPLGEIVLSASDEGLSGLWFMGQKYFTRQKEHIYQEIPLFTDVKRWLDVYLEAKSQTSLCRFILEVRPFKTKRGRFSAKSLMEKRQPMGKSLQKGT